jgi:hypothetical protein
MCCHVAGRSFSSLDIRHIQHNEASGVSEGNKQHGHLLVWQKLGLYASFSIPKESSTMVLRAKGIISASFLGQCCVIPFHAVILFPDQREEKTFITHHHAMNKLIDLDSILSSNCDETFFSLKSVFFLQQVRNSARTNFLGTARCPIPVSTTISLSHIDSL